MRMHIMRQHAYSPRNKVGFRLTDGENMESLWCYLEQPKRCPQQTVQMLFLMLYCTLLQESVLNLMMYHSKTWKVVCLAVMSIVEQAYSLTASSQKSASGGLWYER